MGLDLSGRVAFGAGHGVGERPAVVLVELLELVGRGAERTEHAAGDEEALLSAEAPAATPAVEPRSKQQRAVALTVLCVSAGVLGTLAYQASIDERAAPAAVSFEEEMGVGAMGSVKKHGETTQSDRYTVSGKSSLDSSDQTTLTPVDSKATDETVALMTALSALR